MDLNIKTVLGSSLSVTSQIKDINIPLNLSGFEVTKEGDNEQNQISATELANIERQSIRKHKIYGTIDYLSQLDGITKDYTSLSDFFNTNVSNTKKFIDDFNVLLLKPHNEFIEISGNTYIRQYEVLTSIDTIDILRSGFSKNLFNTQNLNFLFNDTFDLLDKYDGLEYPITDLVLYFHYRKNGSETLSGKTYNNLNEEIFIELTDVPEKGDIIKGEIFTHSPSQYLQTNNNKLEHIIETPYDSGSLKWTYNPFVNIKLLEYSNTLNIVNIKTTNVDKEQSIPFNANRIDDTFYWRDVLDVGYIDPITNSGVNYPFTNGIHYVFINIVFSVRPYFQDDNTFNVFENVILETNTIKRYQPDTLNGIGGLC